MRRTIASALCFLAIASIAGHAQDYQCRKAAGCVARKSENGKMTSVNFRKGDLVSTEDGWVVDPDDGWKKVRSKNGRNS